MNTTPGNDTERSGKKPEAAIADRANAERYRWLRDEGSRTWSRFQDQWRMSADRCDCVIDREMTVKPTPGPWVAELGEAYNVRAPHGGICAQVLHLKGKHGMGGRVPPDEAAANARLIATAPELLAFVKDWLADFTAAGTTDSPHEAQARALIAKAVGE